MARKTKKQANAPGRGSRVSAEVKALFKQEYLRLGTMSAAARAAKLPVSTCTPLVEEAENDPEFVRARKELLTRGLDRVETMLIRGCEVAAERIERDPQVDAAVSIVDVGHNYLRALSDAHRSLTARRKIEHDVDPENKPQWPTEVHIVYKEGGDESEHGHKP